MSQIATRSEFVSHITARLAYFTSQIMKRIIPATNTFLAFNFCAKKNTMLDSTSHIKAITRGNFENISATAIEKSETAIAKNV